MPLVRNLVISDKFYQIHRKKTKYKAVYSSKWFGPRKVILPSCHMCEIRPICYSLDNQCGGYAR